MGTHPIFESDFDCLTEKMPLVIPLKPTVDIDLFKPVASFLRNTFSELGAEAAQEMSRQFDNQRRVACVKALDKTETSLLVLMAYHDQLVKVQGKIPFTEQDCHVKFTWRDPFTSNKGLLGSAKTKVQLASGDFELVCVRWNCAALMTQVAAGQDDTEAGMKAAAKFYNQAAGLFVFIRENIAGVLNKEPPTSDLVGANLNCLSQYCLACAQEAVYTHAKSGRMKQGTIAKVCQQAYLLYSDVTKHADKLGKDLAAYARTKAAYFKAKTQFHAANQAKDGKAFGIQIARLQLAQATLKTILKESPRYKPFNEEIAKELKAAVKDNDFIFHMPVPTSDKLDPISPAIVAKPVEHTRQKLLMEGDGADLFEAVVPIQVHEASQAFDQAKKTKVDGEIERVRALTTDLNGVMRSLHLPEAIEATTGTGIPNSILQKAAEIRVKGGLSKIEEMSAANPACLLRNREISDEAKRILTEESTQDNEMRARFGASWTRKPSGELTKTLRAELNKYEMILGKAMAADETVRQKLDTHQPSLLLMSGTDEQLAAAVPSGSISAVLSGNPIVRELTTLCEQAETMKAERDVIESELRNGQSNMTQQFLTALAQDGALDTETMVGGEMINLYGDLTAQINDSSDRQESLLANLQRCSQEFQHLQKSGAAEEKRTTILNGLQSAFDGFTELSSNLEEGSKFYADLTGILLRLQGKCTDLAFARKTEKDDFLRELTNSAVAPEQHQVNQPAFHHQPAPPQQQQQQQPPQRPPPPQQQQQQPAYAPYTQPQAAAPALSCGAPTPAPRRPPQPHQQQQAPPHIQGPPTSYYQPAPPHQGNQQYQPYPTGQQGYNPFTNGNAPPPSYNAYQQPAYPQQQYPGYPPQGQYPAYPPQQQQQPQPGYNPFAPNQAPGGAGAPPPYPQQ